MYAQKILALICGVVILLGSTLVGIVLLKYLTQYGPAPRFAGIIALVAGCAAALLVMVYGARSLHTRVTGTVVTLLMLLPIASVLAGRISYTRFGLTVYGLVPIPLLDITVQPNGLLWFRDKTHYISREEVESLLRSNPDAVIIGIGWDSMVRVDETIRQIANVHIVSTPEAVSLFNSLRAQGKRPLLIAHSTC